MHRLKKSHFARLSKSLVNAVILFSLVTLPGHLALANGQSGAWRLKAIKVFNTMNRHAVITSERYDQNGGSVEIQVNGNAHNFCPGGIEKMRFTWRFERAAVEVANGSAVNASMDAGLLTRSAPCTGATIAGYSYVTINGSSGGSSSLRPEENRLVDGERFYTRGDGVRVWAAEGQRNGIGSVGVRTHRFYVEQPFAFFTIDIHTRAGGMLRYVYLYQGSGGVAGNSGGGLAVEYDVDRRGGDYRNFDLPQPRPELCHNACANDPNCRAYTYVKPGVQSAGARCWLKSSVPAGGRSGCCISGVKR